jgi:hypothetical protein
MKLHITCFECPATAFAPFDGERFIASELYRELGWIVSVVGSNRPTEPLIAPLCPVCAASLYPELVASASAYFRAQAEHRQRSAN